MELKLRTDFTFSVTSTLVVLNNDTESLDFFVLTIYKNISSVFVFDPIGSLSFTWKVIQTIGSTINITMRYPLLPQDITVFSITYEIDNLLYQVNDPIEYYGFDYEINHSLTAEAFNLEISLPIYASLIKTSSPSPVSPEPNKIYTEDNIVKILWSEEVVTAGEIASYAVRFSFPITQCPSNFNTTVLYYLLVFFGGVVLGGMLLFLFYYIRNKVSEKTELISSLLSDSERDVITVINKDGGVSTQSRICDKTGFSKSKVSQILLKLEKKNVLERERWGRTNKVTITNPNFQNVILDDDGEEENYDKKDK
jgi:uncharacterized membrane protein